MVSQGTKLTRDEAKLHNQRLVLRTIYRAGKVSRAGIARATRLTRSTASATVADLMEQGLVEESGQAPSAGGKPPTLLRVIDDARHIVGLDLAGQALHGGLFDLRGRLVHPIAIPLPMKDGQATLNVLRAAIDQLLATTGKPVVGVGVGLPGLIDVDRGIILRAVNLGWQDLPLGSLLAEHYDLPIYLVNDSQAAALAEYTFAGQAQRQDLALVLVDRGISAGLVLGGRLYRGGTHSGASEIGHVRVVEGGELCACGHFGCLETVASQEAVVRWAQVIFHNEAETSLRRLVDDAGDIDIEIVLRCYHDSNPTLAPVVAQLGRYLGIAVANLISVTNVPQVVLAGSVARFGEDLVQIIRSEVRQRSYLPLAKRTSIRVSELGDHIVMLGAAAALLSNELGIV